MHISITRILAIGSRYQTSFWLLLDTVVSKMGGAGPLPSQFSLGNSAFHLKCTHSAPFSKKNYQKDYFVICLYCKTSESDVAADTDGKILRLSSILVTRHLLFKICFNNPGIQSFSIEIFRKKLQLKKSFLAPCFPTIFLLFSLCNNIMESIPPSSN